MQALHRMTRTWIPGATTNRMSQLLTTIQASQVSHDNCAISLTAVILGAHTACQCPLLTAHDLRQCA